MSQMGQSRKNEAYRCWPTAGVGRAQMGSEADYADGYMTL